MSTPAADLTALRSPPPQLWQTLHLPAGSADDSADDLLSCRGKGTGGDGASPGLSEPAAADPPSTILRSHNLDNHATLTSANTARPSVVIRISTTSGPCVMISGLRMRLFPTAI